MGHEDAVILVPEYVEGRLSGPIAAEVGAHLASCADCSSIEEGYRVISTTLKAEAEAAGSRHPSSDSLVAYATGLGALGADAAALERHLEQCADCASDAEATRAAARAHLAESGRFSRVRASAASMGSGARAAMAAGVVLAVLAYPAYRGLVGPGNPPVTPEWGGTIPLPIVASGHRGAGPEAVSIRIPEGQPFVAFAVDPSLSESPRSTDRFLFELQDESGRVRFRHEIAGARMEELLRPAGVVVLVVPAKDLGPGRYALQMTRPGEPDARESFHASIELTR